MKSGEMLEMAVQIVGGERVKDYGDKLQNHQRIANLWNEWLRQTRKTENMVSEGNIIHPYDVAMMMLLVKVARLMHSPGHQDSHIDIAGYASILEEISNG